uniref:Uncharacterized protein n=1 Tax=Anguilla anguilla TaxID=7936 RepID=A0A0E9SXJ6_ANGAN
MGRRATTILVTAPRYIYKNI